MLDYELGDLELAACQTTSFAASRGDGDDCGSGCSRAKSMFLGDCKAHLQEARISVQGKVAHFAFGVDGGVNVPAPPPFGQGRYV